MDYELRIRKPHTNGLIIRITHIILKIFFTKYFKIIHIGLEHVTFVLLTQRCN